MRFVCAILLCLPLLAGCGAHAASGAPHTQTVDGITVQLTPIPDPPHVGHDTDFAVTVSQGGAPLAGAGVKPGVVHGATDEHGVRAAVDPVHVHDFHATILHLMGLDHTRLTYRHAGRDFRLTDVHGELVRGVLA